MSRRSGQLASKRREELSDLIVKITPSQGKTQIFGSVNLEQFEREYKVDPVDDVQKLGVVHEMNHDGEHCGWRST